jgi:hypothetical protein
MKLKQFLPSLLLLILSSAAFAQSENPFASIGKKGKILTLTKGQYNETFDADSIQQIGSSLINMHTMKVVKLLSDEESKKRLEGEKHSRFLSVDPLTSKFAMLTPYQYASNRPIDGKDLDGLEYVSYIVDIYQYENGATLQTINYKWFDDLQHNKSGELGQGVTYDIRVHTVGGAAYQITPFFVGRQAMASKGFLGLGEVKGDYGNYMGATSLYGVNSHISTTAFDNKRILGGAYNYDIPAVDYVDDQARQHDQGYDALNAKGANSLFKDWSTTPVDDKALKGWNDFLRNAYTGKYTDGNDPFNHQPINDGEVNAALRGSALFSKVINDKLNGISSFMQKNFGSEATKDREANYNLFLSKYMHQEKDGTWKRNEEKWSKQKDGTYTPLPNK